MVVLGEWVFLMSEVGYLFEVAFVWELTKETIVFPLGCLQGGEQSSPVWAEERPSRYTVSNYSCSTATLPPPSNQPSGLDQIEDF